MRLKKLSAAIAALLGLTLVVTACSTADEGEISSDESNVEVSESASPEPKEVSLTTIGPDSPVTGSITEGGVPPMAFEPQGDGYDCAVIDISPEGEVEVVAYFEALVKHDEASLSGPEGPCRAAGFGSFSPDFTQRPATMGYSRSIANDSRVAVVDTNGVYTDLSGYGAEGVDGLNQSYPAFSPDGRVWYWEYKGGVTYELWSVDPEVGASSARHETGYATESVLRSATPFRFVGDNPVSLVDLDDTITNNDGSYIVKKEYGELQVGPVESLNDNPVYSLSGVDGITPLAFMEDTDAGQPQFIGRWSVSDGENLVFYNCVIDDATQTITATPIATPSDGDTTPDINTTATVTPDGTVYYTNTEDDVENDDGRYVYVTRVILLNPDGTGEILAVIERTHSAVRSPAFLD